MKKQFSLIRAASNNKFLSLGDVKTSQKFSRREFLSATAATAFSFTIVPRHVLGGQGQTPPSERLNVAGIGCGGMGGGDIATITKLGANYVALCDVDEARAAGRGR